MPSRDGSGALWLARKEWRELVSSRAWWVMVVATGPIVGMSFSNAVTTYVDLSADPGCGIGCSPLLGIWAPTFGAYEIVAIFFLPFVAIRSLSGDRQSGALTLELQRRFPLAARVAIKGAVIAAGWAIAFAAAGLAVALWAIYGGHISGPELIVVMFGHVLNAVLTIAIALAIAAMTDHPSTAAIVALALTIGTWMIDFAAAVYGGVWTRLAGYTPAAFIGMFQHGLVNVSAVLTAMAMTVGAVGVAMVWIAPGRRVSQRVAGTAAVCGLTAAVMAGAVRAPGTWDASESRVNSFPRPEEESLAGIAAPIHVVVHLAPQDARRPAFERGPLAKLRRANPTIDVSYVARTSTGLYEQSDPGYGEIRYRVGAREAVSRALTDEAVIETILDLAGVSASGEAAPLYRGHPLAVRPTGAALIFYGVWPALCVGVRVFSFRRQS